MKVTPIVDSLYVVNLGMVNAFILDEGELTLVDTGVPGSTEKILAALEELGRRPEELKHIVVTHLHVDHTGSLAELKRRTGATVHMHRNDAAPVAQGRGAREMNPAPGLLSFLVTKLIMKNAPSEIEPCETDEYLEEGQTLAFAGEARVIHVPGHAEGQVALLLPKDGGVLIAADAAANMMGLGYPVVVEDLSVAKRSLSRLSEMEFEHAGFGHGKPIIGGASEAFRRRF